MGYKKAYWGLEYDMHTDKCYKVPTCPTCHTPLFEVANNPHKCEVCEELCELDEAQIAWFEERNKKKVETIECMVCGQNTMVTTYHINLVTGEWEAGWGRCENCGAQFIV